MSNPFLDHPRSAGESYGQHLRFAASIGATMLAGGFACLIHGLAPWAFQTAGSRLLRRAQTMIEARGAYTRPAAKHTPGATPGQTAGRHIFSSITGHGLQQGD